MRKVNTRQWVAGLAVLLAMATAAPIYAWDGTGHTTVALIAWDSLTPAAKEKVSKLLLAHPVYSHYFGHAANGDSVAQADFGVAATFPDLVRQPPPQFHLDRTTYHRDVWHYTNEPYYPIPADKNVVKGIPTPHVLEGASNIIEAFDKNLAILKDSNAGPADQAVALCWVEHLAGDAHQPLHTVALVSKQFPEGDRGGNLFFVRIQNRETALHPYWDHILDTSTPDALCTTIQTAHPAAAFITERRATDFKEWINESYALSVKVAYLDGQLKGVNKNPDDAGHVPQVDAPPAPDTYADQVKTTATQQVALAGYRLADLLNSIYK